MHLVLFDIDGTLTHSQSIDSEVYLRSLAEVFGFANVSSDWSTYRHSTDSGIVREIFRARVGRAPKASEVSAFRKHFVAAIRAAAEETRVREIPGAQQLLRAITEARGEQVGFATGGWSESARCKMSSAGMHFDAFPSASADDAILRTSIVRLAIDRALRRTGDGRHNTIVYVGDGIWDARAARRLRIPFIGVASGDHEDTLRAEGAADVIPCYSDVGAFWTALARARRS